MHWLLSDQYCGQIRSDGSASQTEIFGCGSGDMLTHASAWCLLALVTGSCRSHEHKTQMKLACRGAALSGSWPSSVSTGAMSARETFTYMQVLHLLPFSQSSGEGRAPPLPHLMQDAIAKFVPLVFWPGLQQLIQTKAVICTLQQTREGSADADANNSISRTQPAATSHLSLPARAAQRAPCHSVHPAELQCLP